LNGLLLDSHVWLWLGNGHKLQQSTIDLCTAAAKNRELFLSPFSVLELVRKSKLGLLSFPLPPRLWITETRHRTGVVMAPFDFEVAYDVNELPPEFHKDPVDRVLASVCRIHGFTLLTRDELLLHLASKSSYRALRA